ncbi:MAG: asparagine synthase (glutamine-hydrolyzing) [Acidobacteriota bacterium]|nr:asparagine synthase (glutamine-hydrolyzing) [Acidobacteriota bacterium]
MCGIAGFAGPGDIEILRKMTDCLTHRGPDDEGFSQDADVFLGHRRLTVLDPEGGRQPMWTRDGELAVVFNGEIYNHAELRVELEQKGHRFQSDHSDTETLLFGYREWGADLLPRLNGMFAFVIYDRKKRRLFGARDRFGQKPLYYAMRGNLFAFASESSALIQHPHIDAEISKLSLAKYFGHGYIPAPHSLYTQINKLPGGWSLTWDIAKGELEKHCWWRFKLEPEPDWEEDQTAEQLLALLDDAVAGHLEADVPLGVFLSGGIDSSTIAAMAARHVDADNLHSFSIGFEEPSFDESAYARLAASHVGGKHHLRTVAFANAHERVAEILARLDEPLGDSSLLPTWLLCGFAREKVTVALGGDGADELFAGYDPFRALRLASLYSKYCPKPVHRVISLMVSRLPVSHRNMSLDFKLKKTLSGLDYPEPWQLPVWMAPIPPSALEEVILDPPEPEAVYSEALALWDASETKNPVDRTLEFFTNLYLQDGILVKLDRAAMMHGLETRSPFLDNHVVDFVRRMSTHFKFNGKTTKYILRKAVQPLLPDSVLKRPKKGFGSPVGAWFKDGKLSLPATFDLPYLNQAGITERLRRHRRGKIDDRLFLWACRMLLKNDSAR